MNRQSHFSHAGICTKKDQSVTVGGKQVLLLHALEVPEEFNVVQICEAVEIDRPRLALAVDNCRPNYASWASMKETLRTIFRRPRLVSVPRIRVISDFLFQLSSVPKRILAWRVAAKF